MSLIVNNIEGNVNEAHICNYKEDIYMMKYLDLRIMSGEEIQ